MDVVRRVISVGTLCGLPRPLQVGIYSLVGVAVGMALVLVRIANATSYLSDSPQTCINCHVMTDAYASWQRGSHGRVAVCVDCHVPYHTAGGTGKHTDEMQSAEIFCDAGWDFVAETEDGTEDAWWIDEGEDYPRLRWEYGLSSPSGPKTDATEGLQAAALQ